ncbi:MAG: DNA polymerase II [Candidatus Omnitrophica bacterium CG11_big_fil_rev_8_21_14_0_20_63_9]|nr:MAG: DNA polymerase II [Candidatus Omnitrophica bacterium CG11_big_fil_rev_8_21_14_0_20_63_9]
MTPTMDTHAVLGKGSPEALEVTEAARESEWRYPSLVADLFMGRLRRDLLLPFPEQDEADRREGDQFLARLATFLKEHIDPEEIDRTGEIPAQAIQGLASLGCFGMKIPKAYGGLGLSHTNYSRVIALLGSHCGSTTVWLSAHQSIGAPQPLMLFGTDEQKQRYLPKLAQGTVSAFALTEPEVGSDPANMTTTATPVEGGEFYVLNGEKLWCTNGPVAEVVVVMARTPSVTVGGRERKQITAFIVERSMPGFEVSHRCSFMGLKGIQNGVLKFHNVRVPKSNIIWGLGMGLKLALVTLNAGRIAIPAGSVGGSKRCLQISRRWAKERKQWGGPIGKHEAVAAKIGEMAATTFAMEAMVELTAALVDRKTIDIRLEAALAKLFCTEASWRIIDDTIQIRGGRGYETYHSLQARGETPYPVERMMRDARINRIIEGTSEIMRLFIAREALDAHMRLVSRLLDPHQPVAAKMSAALGALGHYALWYPKQWLFWGWWPKHADLGPKLGSHLRFVERTSHRLARTLFHSAARYQTKLAYRQQLLGRLVDVGAELFAMVAACAKAHAMIRLQPSEQSPVELADLFCRLARRRVTMLMKSVSSNEDRKTYRMAQDAMAGRLEWLEEGIL